jgi:SAM-dependent methyltransferase
MGPAAPDYHPLPMPDRTADQPEPRNPFSEMWCIFRLALRVRRDPVPFIRRVSAGMVRHLRARGVVLEGVRTLDAGTGGGAVPEALAAAGARVVALDVQDHRNAALVRTPFVRGRADRLPFRKGAFGLVTSSNVLEHVPDARAMVAELLRVCAPGGAVVLSWTTWYSPIGGHELSPFHYLGPRLGTRAYRMVRRRDPPWNVPGQTLFPVHVGTVLRLLRASPQARIRDVAPRYWPWARFLARVPGLREVAMWNCVIILEPAAEAGP